MPDCPECGAELVWSDWYGHGPNIESRPKDGDIYRCPNEDCPSDGGCRHWHTRPGDGDLHEGYPC